MLNCKRNVSILKLNVWEYIFVNKINEEKNII